LPWLSPAAASSTELTAMIRHRNWSNRPNN
jgi:hypothetical protein